jgi:hypothetical protein
MILCLGVSGGGLSKVYDTSINGSLLGTSILAGVFIIIFYAGSSILIGENISCYLGGLIMLSLSIVSYGVLSIIFLASSYSLTSFSSLYF